MIVAWVVVVSFLMISLGLFAGATLFYVQGRIERERAEEERETTRILQERAIVAQAAALDLASRAREFIL